jgi:hypothetical protein
MILFECATEIRLDHEIDIICGKDLFRDARMCRMQPSNQDFIPAECTSA